MSKGIEAQHKAGWWPVKSRSRKVAITEVHGFRTHWETDRAMKELLRSNDPVKLSWCQAMLADAGIEAMVMDQHMSVLEGSIGALQRRLMVLEEDHDAARRILAEAGEDLAG